MNFPHFFRQNATISKFENYRKILLFDKLFMLEKTQFFPVKTPRYENSKKIADIVKKMTNRLSLLETRFSCPNFSLSGQRSANEEAAFCQFSKTLPRIKYAKPFFAVLRSFMWILFFLDNFSDCCLVSNA